MPAPLGRITENEYKKAPAVTPQTLFLFLFLIIIQNISVSRVLFYAIIYLEYALPHISSCLCTPDGRP